MGAADEVAEMYTFNGTHIMTLPAARALIIINHSKIILNLYSAVGTGFLTLSAADTTVQAYLADLSALIVVRALDDNARGVVNEVNNTVGTSFDAKTAAYAPSWVNLRYIFLGIDAYSVSWADLHAVTVAKTRKGTESVAGIVHISRRTAGYTLIAVFSLLRSAGAVTAHVSDALNNVARRKSHNLSYLTCDTVAAGNTEARIIGGAVTKSLGVSVTA